MATIYHIPDAGHPVWEVAAAVLDREGSLKAIRDAGVTYGIVFAWNEKGEALKHAGYPAAAVIKINSYKERVQGKPDCTILIDETEWKNAEPKKRQSLLHHELLHLELVTIKAKDPTTGVKMDTGKPKLDDCGRPKLKMRLHDFQVGVFTEIMEKYGVESFDVDQVAPLVKWVQAELHFG